MNIGLVVHRFSAAEGTGGYAVQLARHLAARHRVTIYAHRVDEPPPPNARVVPVPALSGRAYATVLSFPRSVRRVLEQHDVVHAQGWVASEADVVTAHIVMAAWRDAARRAGVPTPWGERILGGRVQKWEGELLARRAKAVIAPSHKAKEDIATHYRREEGVYVVHHGFPEPRPLPSRADARRRLGVDPRAFVLLYAGDARKGLIPAIRAMACRANGLLVVASHSSPHPYVQIAQRHGVANRLLWLGASLHLDWHYGAADALLHPSIYDSFGLVVAEALSFGVPVITSPAAGISELLEDGISGLVVPHDDAEGIAERIDLLAGDPSVGERLGANGRALAQSRSWDVVLRETLQVYERVA
jgi:glycosyltransferase involved in cell wall biosynthesis